MRLTLLMHLAAAMQLAPPLVGVSVGRAATPARRWTVVWCLLMALQDLAMLSVSAGGSSNLWVLHIADPITGGAALWTLSHWHEGGTARLALRASIPLFAVVSVTLTFVLDDPRYFSLFTGPFNGLVLLLASLWTFVSRSMTEREGLVRSDWFWVTGGLMLYAAPVMALQPVLWVLYDAGRQDLLMTASNVRLVTMILAFATISGGMLCPLPQMPSGPRSSPPSSPQSSSSPGSVSRW